MEKYQWRGSTEMIDKSHPSYAIVVVDHGERDYAIIAKNIPIGEQVQCPHDKDMTVTRDSDNSVLLSKKCFLKNRFSR